ncbi:hypothetical protein BZG00_10695 [Salinivibrio kushneri]|uniref:Glycosyltransferase family 4 protein n=1 Tax=Salinivibrio kushneri TaxID=1908198 RepID=A0AB36JUP4_9GAMM|nr:glycosyltransferase family 4 protein [Salinivibrio kushneri]OOE39346.1 hypothetical protein BZG00_10695 [Salinivibrio kushneri]QCP02420.1 glycosyltransferase family 4 protein [Salinivibrio kushneri]
MKFLISVFFNAPQGGLHENVRFTAQRLLAEGHSVSLICKSGPFADQMAEMGVGVFNTDFAITDFKRVFEQVKIAHQQVPFDIIHAHPFLSRQLAVVIGQCLAVPVIETMHGQYLDQLPNTIAQLDAVVCVSEGIKQYLFTEQSGLPAEKFFVVPNVPDVTQFKYIATPPSTDHKNKVVIALVSRLDRDKQFILDLFLKAVDYTAQTYAGKIHWQIIGQGTEAETFLAQLADLQGENTVEFSGWLQGKDLQKAYCGSHAVIAPGRCAIEALSCAIPAIALGSKGYIGLVDEQRWQAALYSNFGGVGQREQGYQAGSIEADIDRLMQSAKYRRQLGRFGRQLVRSFLSAKQAHQTMKQIYRTVVQARKMTPLKPVAEQEFLALQCTKTNFLCTDDKRLTVSLEGDFPESTQFAWYLHKQDRGVIEKQFYTSQPHTNFSPSEPGDYRVQCYLKNSIEKISFFTESISVSASQLKKQ